MNLKPEQHHSLLTRLLLVLLGLVVFYFAFLYAIPLFFDVAGTAVYALMPFIIALIIAILIDPIVDWLVQKKGIKRGLAVAFTLSILLTLLILLVIFAISRLVIELTDLYYLLPTYTQHLAKYGLDYFEQARNYLYNNPLPPEAQNALKNNLQFVISEGALVVSALTNFLIGLLTGLPGFLTIVIVAGVATFFISRDKNTIARFIYRIMPQRLVRPLSLVVGEVSQALLGFFRAQTILITITGLQTIIGLYLLGVNYALTIGLVVAFLDLLPVLGPGAVFVPWAVLEFILGKVNLGLGLLVLYAVLIGVRQLIEPKILSESIGLHPLATLMALYLGLQLIGVWGIILGPFLVIVCKAVYKSLHDPIQK